MCEGMFVDEEEVAAVGSCFGITPKKEQVDVVLKLSKGRDVVARLPTTFGKSFLYQSFAVKIALRPQIYQHHSVIVVNPLTALVEDQLQALERSQNARIQAAVAIETNSTDIASGRFHIGLLQRSLAFLSYRAQYLRVQNS